MSNLCTNCHSRQQGSRRVYYDSCFTLRIFVGSGRNRGNKWDQKRELPRIRHLFLANSNWKYLVLLSPCPVYQFLIQKIGLLCFLGKFSDYVWHSRVLINEPGSCGKEEIHWGRVKELSLSYLFGGCRDNNSSVYFIHDATEKDWSLQKSKIMRPKGYLRNIVS